MQFVILFKSCYYVSRINHFILFYSHVEWRGIFYIYGAMVFSLHIKERHYWVVIWSQFNHFFLWIAFNIYEHTLVQSSWIVFTIYSRYHKFATILIQQEIPSNFTILKISATSRPSDLLQCNSVLLMPFAVCHNLPSHSLTC